MSSHGSLSPARAEKIPPVAERQVEKGQHIEYRVAARTLVDAIVNEDTMIREIFHVGDELNDLATAGEANCSEADGRRCGHVAEGRGRFVGNEIVEVGVAVWRCVARRSVARQDIKMIMAHC